MYLKFKSNSYKSYFVGSDKQGSSDDYWSGCTAQVISMKKFISESHFLDILQDLKNFKKLVEKDIEQIECYHLPLT